LKQKKGKTNDGEAESNFNIKVEHKSLSVFDSWVMKGYRNDSRKRLKKKREEDSGWSSGKFWTSEVKNWVGWFGE
jgi:hypothetical protein